MPTSFLELTHAMLVSHFRLFSLELHLDFCSAISSCFQFPSDPCETKCKDRLDISSLAATSIDHCYVFRVDSANTFEPLCKYLYLCVVSKTKHTIYSNIGHSISRRVSRSPYSKAVPPLGPAKFDNKYLRESSVSS